MIKNSTWILSDSTKKEKLQFMFAISSDTSEQNKKLKQRAASAERFCKQEKSNPMFSNISWSEYLTFILVSALIWYAYVFYAYFRYDLFQSISGKKADSSNAIHFGTASTQQTESSPVNFQGDQPQLTETNQSQVIESFVEEVRAYLNEAGQEEIPKESLIQSLSRITNKYSLLSQSEYKASLDQFIIQEAEANCAVLLDKNEVSRIWSGS
jgi:hypothetical protein